MSFNRENITWQSPDKTWNLGFYRVAWTDFEGDPEWDVEYDYSTFEWVTTGHSSEESARKAWHGANPGGTFVVPFDPAEADRTEALDQMAAASKKRMREEDMAARRGRGWY